MLIILAVLGASSSWAEVLVLQDHKHISDAQILRNDHGTIIYRKNGRLCQVQSDLIMRVEYKIPGNSEPYEEQEWEPADASLDTAGGEETAAEERQDAPAPAPSTEEQTETPAPAVEEQEEGPAPPEKKRGRPVKKHSVTIGFLQGGGSLIGADFEFLLGDSPVGLQFGGGLLGYDVGLNFHFQPSVHSHYLSLGFWNQGGGDAYAQYLGVTFGWRAFGWMNAQLGLGAVVAMSPRMRESLSSQGAVPPVMLLYCIGAYF